VKASKSKESPAAALESKAMELDRVDRDILRLLQEDARMTFAEIGRQVHLSQPAVAERVRALEEQGVILGYHAVVDTTRLGFPITAWIHVEARTIQESRAATEVILALPEALECHAITGRDGLLVKVACPSIARLSEIIRDIAAVSAPFTSIVLHSQRMRKSV
jgi:Lrp/AsnC family transcriptional regulator, leucine-responsive regulatory protein